MTDNASHVISAQSTSLLSSVSMSDSELDLLSFYGRPRKREAVDGPDVEADKPSKNRKRARKEGAVPPPSPVAPVPSPVVLATRTPTEEDDPPLDLPTWTTWKKNRLMFRPLFDLFKRNADWVDALGGESATETALRIASTKLVRCMTRTPGKEVFPPLPQVFRAFELVKPQDVRVVILGQDPYPTKGNAHGLAFSKLGTGIPASLRNMFKEIRTSLGCLTQDDANLERWSRQGVLLLNTDLTVPEGSAGKHGGAWASLTTAVLKCLSEREEGVAFVTWGKPAQRTFGEVVQYVDTQHLHLKAPHPSPYSASTGFFGCDHFVQINAWLEKQGKPEIDWS